jgi:single-strand DNA-binding protein
VKFDRGKGKDKKTTIARFALATNEAYGDAEPMVHFHNMVAFGGRAELCYKWCKKGMLIGIKGKLRQNRWVDDQGNKRSVVQVNIDEITFLGKKEEYADGPKEKEPKPKTKGKKDPF